MTELAIEPARRVEIFTGSGRRREWPAAVKAQIVAESFSSPLSVSDVARRHGLCVAQLFTWRRQARARQAPVGPAARAFVPVQVQAPEEQGLSAVSALVSIEVAGAVLRVPAGLDPTSITALVRAIRAAS